MTHDSKAPTFGPFAVFDAAASARQRLRSEAAALDPIRLISENDRRNRMCRTVPIPSGLHRCSIYVLFRLYVGATAIRC